MNSLLTTPLAFPPHLHQDPRLSPVRSMSSQMTTSSRKRKADDDETSGYQEDRMSASPSNSPALPSRSLPAHRHKKRARPNLSGRALSLPRLLETLDADALRSALQTICQRHPDIASELVNTAPRPSVESALQVLSRYEQILRASFPLGGNPASDYSYNRVRQPLQDLYEALNDFTPHFLPPNESQTSTSLSYLDGATDIIHKIPTWDSLHHNLDKQSAYEEISKAWVLVIREAAKRGGGIQLQYGGWDQKLTKHNELAGENLRDAVHELRSNLGWIAGGSSTIDDRASIRQQLLSGTYGSNASVRVGPW